MRMRLTFISLILFAAAVAGSVAYSAEAEPRVRIDQVEISGITVLSAEVVESAVEVSPGEDLQRSKVVRSAENLQSILRSKGYERATIQSRLSRKKGEGGAIENVLEISVQEGSPTRIAAVRFVRDESLSTAFGGAAQDASWKRMEKILTSKMSSVAGGVFDQDRIAEAKSALQIALNDEQYVGAKIEDVRISTVTNPDADALTAAGSTPTGRWVELEFRVQLGDRVSFGFRGNTILTESKLASFVDEQRSLGFGKDYVGAIQGRILEEYRALGFARVRIEPYSYEVSGSGERHVTYVITEGPRVRIEDVDFEGNTIFSDRELTDQFFSLGVGMVERQYYVEKDVQKTAELLVEWMKSKGYLGAKLITVSTSYIPKARKLDQYSAVKLTIYLYEWDRTLVQSAHFDGLTVFTPDEVKSILGLKQGEPFNIFAFNEGIQVLKARYRAEGYLAMSIANEASDSVVKYSDENRLADIYLNIHEGAPYRVSRILIEGNKQTRDVVIQRELAFHVGEILKEPEIAESETNLRRLGIFSTVRVESFDDASSPNHKIVKITVDEAAPGVIAGGPGFRNDLGIRAFGEFGYTNISGMNHSIFFDGAANRRLKDFRFAEYNAQLAYNWPWFAGYDITFRPTLTVTGNQFSNFDAVSQAVALNWQKRLLRSPNLSALFTYALERVYQFDAPEDVDNGIFRIGSVTPSLRLDLRDNPLAPTKGLFSQASFEIADPILGSQRAPSPIGYTRFQFRSDYTLPIWNRISGFFSFRSGFLRSTQSSSNDDPTSTYGSIPLIKQFALGGIGSLRGFAEQELNNRNLVLKGTQTYVNYRSQVDFPISGGLRFGPFLDAANLQTNTFSFGNLRYGAGFGLHYMTPVGPVNLDWGFKLDPREGESPSQFYFSIGVI